MFYGTTPTLRRHYPRRPLTTWLNIHLDARDAVKISCDYLEYIDNIYNDYRIILDNSNDLDFKDQVVTRIFKIGQWKAFFKNLICWFRESPNSQRLPQVLQQHAAQIDSEMANFRRITNEYEANQWRLPSRRPTRYMTARGRRMETRDHHEFHRFGARTEPIQRYESGNNRPQPLGRRTPQE